MPYNEADTSRVFVTQQLKDAGWDDREQIKEQVTFTDGRINVSKKKTERGPQKRADYILRYRRDYAIAVVEAKEEGKSAYEGLEQAKEYAEILGYPFAYATNGHEIIEYDFSTGIERKISEYPGPKELWNRYRVAKGLPEALDDKLLVPYYESDKMPRYYQQIAINRAVEAILKGDKRVLLTLATGTGKTMIAFQIAWKLWSARWNTSGSANRPRILFLADRTVLVDDPKDKTFAPFGNARWKIEGGVANQSHEMYFATYQAIAKDEARPGLYNAYDPNFFDLIIVDEAHRGSARDDSNWREILEHFTGAVQLGMTATPLREENRDTYEYFGDPIYTYSLKQGIQDGFLAPYEVYRIVLDVDATGYRPYAEQTDLTNRVIPDRLYTSREFERILVIKERTEAVARHLTAYLKKHGRDGKTIIFCVDQNHAQRMRAALAMENADLMRQHSDYVVRITANDGDIGKSKLKDFQDIESESPIIVTTSRLLSTGVDVPMVKNVVIFRMIDSMVEFKQIIGRGTRVREDYGKLYFTILDYTGSATTKFADKEFDGEPIKVEGLRLDDNGDVIEEIELTDEPASYDGEETEAGTQIYMREGGLEEKGSKYVVSGVSVEVLNEVVWMLGPDGKRMQMVQLTSYTGDQVRNLYPNADDFRSAWAMARSRQEIVKQLAERGIDLEHVATIADEPDADAFDLLAHLAYSVPIQTRRQRANRLLKEKGAFFAKYSPQAQAILKDILEKYAEYGPDQIVPDVLTVQPIASKGNTLEITRLFGSAQNLLGAMAEIQNLLYAA